MADIKKYFPKLLKWEGNGIFHNDVADTGGATKNGVTLATFRQMGYDNDGDGDIDVEDLKASTTDQAMAICKKGYWDRIQADLIKSQAVAESLAEWVWGSGKWGIIIPQRIMGLKDDGVFGPKTLEAVNKQDPVVFHEKLRQAKLSFIDGIVIQSISAYKALQPNATQQDLLKYTNLKFEKGWKNRVNAFTYEPNSSF